MNVRDLYALLTSPDMGYTLDVGPLDKGEELRLTPPRDTLSPVMQAVVKSHEADLIKLSKIKLMHAETNRRIVASAPANWEFPSEDACTEPGATWGWFESEVEHVAHDLRVNDVRTALGRYEAFAMAQFARMRFDASPPIATGEPTLAMRPTLPAEPSMAEIERALGLLLFQGNTGDRKPRVTELRVLGAGGENGRTDVGFFDERHLSHMAKDAMRASHRGAKGVYVTLNPVAPEALQRSPNGMTVRADRGTGAKDVEITRRVWLPIDFDPTAPRRPAGVSSTDDELVDAHAKADEVANWLQDRGWPAPVRATSGNGAHLLWPIDLPNTEEVKQTIAGCLKAINQKFSVEGLNIDTTNSNASRIWKLYGTVARKGEHTPERPHRLATIDSIPDLHEVVRAEQLTALAAEYVPAESSPRTSSKGGGANLSVLDRIRMATKYTAESEGAVEGKGDNRGEKTTVWVACNLVKGFNLTPGEAWPIFLDWNKRCKPPWDERRLFRKLEEADRMPDKHPRGYRIKESNN